MGRKKRKSGAGRKGLRRVVLLCFFPNELIKKRAAGAAYIPYTYLHLVRYPYTMIVPSRRGYGLRLAHDRRENTYHISRTYFITWYPDIREIVYQSTAVQTACVCSLSTRRHPAHPSFVLILHSVQTAESSRRLKEPQYPGIG